MPFGASLCTWPGRIRVRGSWQPARVSNKIIIKINGQVGYEFAAAGTPRVCDMASRGRIFRV